MGVFHYEVCVLFFLTNDFSHDKISQIIPPFSKPLVLLLLMLMLVLVWYDDSSCSKKGCYILLLLWATMPIK
jgi:hypothetical protein